MLRFGSLGLRVLARDGGMKEQNRGLGFKVECLWYEKTMERTLSACLTYGLQGDAFLRALLTASKTKSSC